MVKKVMNSRFKIALFLDFCNGILMNSYGIAKQHLPAILGKYYFYQSFNGNPSFKHAERNYYIYWAPDDKWRVCTANNRFAIISY